MATVKNFKLLNFLTLFVLISSVFASAAVNSPFLPTAWWGYTTIDGNNATTGTPVHLYLAGNLESSTQTPTISTEAANHYYISQVGLEGNSVELQVCGLTAHTTTWTIANSGNTIRQDLAINTLGQGASCDFACACTGGFCVNSAVDGRCSNTNYYCDADSVCETSYGEDCSTCASDCGSCPGFGPSGSGGGGGGGGSSSFNNPNRVCDEWSTCEDGTQTRECSENNVDITESRACSTESEEEFEVPLSGDGFNAESNDDSPGSSLQNNEESNGFEEPNTEGGNEITGAVVGGGSNNNIWYLAGALGAVALLGGSYFFIKRRK